jgi:hypothetical protein
MLISMDMDAGIDAGTGAGMTAKSRWEADSCQEIMRVEWNTLNPVMAGLQEVETCQTKQRYAMPPSMVEMDVEAFLRKMATPSTGRL